MATAKKTTKKPVTKKVSVHKSAKTTVKRATKTAKTPAMRSFAVAEPTEPFFTFRISHQTLYWLVLALFVLFLGLWVININDKVQRIYDQIDQTNAAISSMPEPKMQKAAH